MRRRILAALAAAFMATAAPAAADTTEDAVCRTAATVSVCVWVLEPNPSGGVFHVTICHGRACFDIAGPVLEQG